MLYRAGWGLKDESQRRILAIDITRTGFEWALENSCPNHPDPGMSHEEWQHLKEKSPVRIQWDPERDLLLQPQSHRTIQIGLSKEAVRLYVNEWIQSISDITPLAISVHTRVLHGQFSEAADLLPKERPYSSDLIA